MVRFLQVLVLGASIESFVDASFLFVVWPHSVFPESKLVGGSDLSTAILLPADMVAFHTMNLFIRCKKIRDSSFSFDIAGSASITWRSALVGEVNERFQIPVTPQFPNEPLVAVFHVSRTNIGEGIVVIFQLSEEVKETGALIQSVEETLPFLLSRHTDDQAAAEAVLALHVKWHLRVPGPIEFNANFLVIGVENDQLKELQFPDAHGFVKIFDGGLIVTRKSNQTELSPPVAIHPSISNVKWVKRGDLITELHTDVRSASRSKPKDKVLPEAPPEASENFQTGVEFPVQSSEFPYAGVLTDPNSGIKYYVFDLSKSVKEDVSIREHRPTNQQEVPFHADFAVAAINDLVRITRALENPIQYNNRAEPVSSFRLLSRISSAKLQSVSLSKDSLQLEQPSSLLRLLYPTRLGRFTQSNSDLGFTGAAEVAVTIATNESPLDSELRDNLTKALEEAMK